jgi:hypothetical protein
MTGKETDQDKVEPELQLEFHGCIVPLASDKPQKPAKLTREQTRQLAEIIYLSFKEWYAQ